MSKCYTSGPCREMGSKPHLRVDFWAWNAFILCLAAAMFSAYWFVEAQTSGSATLMLYTANFIVFMLLLLSGVMALIVLWVLGVVNFDYKTWDLKEMGSTLGYGVAFAGIISLVTFPISSYYGGNLAASIMSVGVTGTLGIVVLLTVLAPGGEELFNNGAIYGFADLALPNNSFPSFLVKGGVRATVFTVSHFWAYTLTGGTILFIFASGYVLSFAYWYTGVMGVPIIAHLTWNLLMLHLAGVI